MVDLVKIGDVSIYRKEFFEISNSEDYKRCRVRLHKKGVVLRDVIKGKDIKTKKQRLCKTNDFIVAEMDAKFGGYGIIPETLNSAIVSSHYYLFELNEEKVLPEYFKVLIDTDVIQSQIKAKGSTNYSRVSPKEVMNFEIPCPSLEFQQQVILKYSNSKKDVIKILKEASSQESLLKQLRQSIFQEAVEGKLTVEWRKQNPELISGENHAARLLEKIKTEKEQLIKEGNPSTGLRTRIKKQKTLPSISEEDLPAGKAGKPFGLPEGWIWCRLGDVAEHSLGKMLDKGKNKGAYQKYLRNLNVRWFEFDLDDLLEMRIQKNEHIKYSIQKDDLVICEGGYPGRAAIWNNYETIFFQKALHRVRFYINGMNKYYL